MRRLHAASMSPKFGLIITGGYSERKRVKTVESTLDGKHFHHSLPDLPRENENHCQVTVDDRTIMVFGGCLNGDCYSKTAWKLDTVEKKWTRLPNMPTGRHSTACGVISEGGIPRRIVVAGGWQRGLLNTVEVLDLSTLTWSTGT